MNHKTAKILLRAIAVNVLGVISACIYSKYRMRHITFSLPSSSWFITIRNVTHDGALLRYTQDDDYDGKFTMQGDLCSLSLRNGSKYLIASRDSKDDILETEFYLHLTGNMAYITFPDAYADEQGKVYYCTDKSTIDTLVEKLAASRYLEHDAIAALAQSIETTGSLDKDNNHPTALHEEVIFVSKTPFDSTNREQMVPFLYIKCE
ncbi:MAG: hypothetical protein II295_04095 [Akkermansia sp.]|jgi:hypothetical protein|nr:hypothetical protein [Akkermansia sp.]